jgi:hypothetical protein
MSELPLASRPRAIAAGRSQFLRYTASIDSIAPPRGWVANICSAWVTTISLPFFGPTFSLCPSPVEPPFTSQAVSADTTKPGRFAVRRTHPGRRPPRRTHRACYGRAELATSCRRSTTREAGSATSMPPLVVTGGRADHGLVDLSRLLGSLCPKEAAPLRWLSAARAEALEAPAAAGGLEGGQSQQE